MANPNDAVTKPPWNEEGPSNTLAMDCKRRIGFAPPRNREVTNADVISRIPHIKPPKKIAGNALDFSTEITVEAVDMRSFLFLFQYVARLLAILGKYGIMILLLRMAVVTGYVALFA